jgi:hypothetical protein
MNPMLLLLHVLIVTSNVQLVIQIIVTDVVLVLLTEKVTLHFVLVKIIVTKM